MNDIAFSVIINNDGIDDIIFKTIMVKGEKGDGGTGIDHIEKTSTSGNVDTYTIYLEDGSVAGTFTVTNAILPETATIENVEIASFSDGADDVPVSELIVDIEPVQSGSGEPSPTNVRPISGWDECNVTRTGKNLFANINPILGRYLSDNGSQILYSGWNISDFIPIKGGQTYHFKPNSTEGGSAFGFFYANDSVESTIVASKFNSGEVTITAPNDAQFVRFSYRDTSLNIQLELGSTATAYEPFKGGTETIDFGQTTAFRGFLDVLNGKLTLTHAKYVYNSENIPTMSEAAMSGVLGGKTRIFINQSGISRGGGSGVVDGEICDKYDSISSDFMYRGNQGISLRDNVTTGFYIYNPDIQGITAWQQEISTNGLEVVAPLAEPIVIQLTPAQVRTLLNDNNIFADTGKIQKVTYFKTGCEALARLIDAFK